jgi:acetate kinase
MACVKDGRAVDTTMGFTPLEGLVMGTRTGDIDAGVILHLLDRGIPLEEIRTGLQQQGGLSGLSGVSHDVRDLLSADRPETREAINVFVHRVRKYVGAFLVQLDRCDALVFTGGIGENACRVRERICRGLERFGIQLDPKENDRQKTSEREIQSPDSDARILVIPTNEELAIAKETAAVVENKT